MPQPPVTPIIPYELVRPLPPVAQDTFVGQILAGAGVSSYYDVAVGLTDPNQFTVGAPPAPAGVIQKAIGPYLDAVAFSDQIGRIDVYFAVDDGATFRLLNSTPVAASSLVNIAGLRITARYLQVAFTNLGGVASNTEFGIFIRGT